MKTIFLSMLVFFSVNIYAGDFESNTDCSKCPNPVQSLLSKWAQYLSVPNDEEDEAMAGMKLCGTILPLKFASKDFPKNFRVIYDRNIQTCIAPMLVRGEMDDYSSHLSQIDWQQFFQPIRDFEVLIRQIDRQIERTRSELNNAEVKFGEAQYYCNYYNSDSCRRADFYTGWKNQVSYLTMRYQRLLTERTYTEELEQLQSREVKIAKEVHAFGEMHFMRLNNGRQKVILILVRDVNDWNREEIRDILGAHD
ncbi:MAG: hypothetical protein KDD61_03655 [Bdellovibrionales bacterium]|nr:hypothetical protein [Bdellovibrionales bacterium]